MSTTPQPEMKPAYLIAGSDWPKVDAATARLRARVRLRVGRAARRRAGTSRSTLPPSATRSTCWAASGWCWCATPRQLEDEPDRGHRRVPEAPDARHVPGASSAPAASARSIRWSRPSPSGRRRAHLRRPRPQAGRRLGGQRFAESGARCPPPVARRLVELAGEDVGDLALEVEKLIAYACGGDPTVEDVELLVIPQPDVKPWDITDAWGRRDAAAVDPPGNGRHRAARAISAVRSAQLASHIRKVYAGVW